MSKKQMHEVVEAARQFVDQWEEVRRAKANEHSMEYMWALMDTSDEMEALKAALATVEGTGE